MSVSAIRSSSTSYIPADDSSTSATSTSGMSASSSSDPGAEIAELEVELGTSQEKSDNVARQSAEKAEDDAESNQVMEMRHKAEEMKVGAWTSGLIEIGSAGAMACGAAGLGGDTGAKWWDAVSKGLDAGSKLASGVQAASEAGTDADVTAADHAGQHAKRAADDAKADADQAQKLVDKALEFYQGYTGAEQANNMAAVRRA